MTGAEAPEKSDLYERLGKIRQKIEKAGRSGNNDWLKEQERQANKILEQIREKGAKQHGSSIMPDHGAELRDQIKEAKVNRKKRRRGI